jgi:ligand-binding SRPBCC domain-containing protein
MPPFCLLFQPQFARSSKSITFRAREVKTSLFSSELLLPRARNKVFPFFANAENLEALTPPWLRFRIVTECPITMQKGCLIDYNLRVHGIPLRWRTQITAWEPPFRFVDTMLRGPYRAWIHEHIFEERPDGTLVIDRVNYAVPGGRMVDRLFVRRDIESIFAFRRQKLLQIFSQPD